MTEQAIRTILSLITDAKQEAINHLRSKQTGPVDHGYWAGRLHRIKEAEKEIMQEIRKSL